MYIILYMQIGKGRHEKNLNQVLGQLRGGGGEPPEPLREETHKTN